MVNKHGELESNYGLRFGYKCGWVLAVCGGCLESLLVILYMDQNLWLDAQDMVSEWTTNNKIAQQTTQQTWSDLSQWTSLSSHWSGLTLGALLLLHYHTTHSSSHSHDHDTECRHGHAELRLLIRGANIIVSKCCFKLLFLLVLLLLLQL